MKIMYNKNYINRMKDQGWRAEAAHTQKKSRQTFSGKNQFQKPCAPEKRVRVKEMDVGQERANLQVLRQFVGDELKFLVAHNTFRSVIFCQEMRWHQIWDSDTGAGERGQGRMLTHRAPVSQPRSGWVRKKETEVCWKKGAHLRKEDVIRGMRRCRLPLCCCFIGMLNSASNLLIFSQFSN